MDFIMNLTKKTALTLTIMCLIPIALAKPKRCNFSDLQGEYPAEVRYICEDLKAVKDALDNDKKFPYQIENRLLMYGPPGNGKTTVANEIAKETRAHLIGINGPEIVQEYIGTGAKEVKKLFTEAINYAEVHNRPVVIVIDEIDAFAEHVESEHRAEHKAILQEVWHMLDVIKDDPRLFFVALTNSEKLNETFRTRFGNNICKITPPDAATRRALLEKYLMDYTGKRWKKSMLDDLVNRTDNEKFSIRFLISFVKALATQARHDYEGKITKTLVDEVFEEIKVKYYENWVTWGKRIVKENAREIGYVLVRATT